MYEEGINISEYTPVYTKPYEEGFINAPPYETPITAEVLNAYDSVIQNIEKYLKDNPFGGNSIDLSNGTVNAVLNKITVMDCISMGRRDGTNAGSKSQATGSGVTERPHSRLERKCMVCWNAGMQRSGSD